MTDFYRKKYLKYKQKYLELRDMYGGGKCFEYGLQQHKGECWHDSITMMLFQSDITNKNDELLNISDDQINRQYTKLLELFSPENIEKNAYKLPTEIYIYYLKNKTNPDINDNISKFLDISKKYMFGQVKRIKNRLKHDIPRYNPLYLLTSFRDGRELFEEQIIRELKKNDELFKEMLLKTPDYPDRENILRRFNMTEKEREEYKKTQEYQLVRQQLTQMINTEYKKRELESKQIESTLPKTEKIARRLSFRKSIECSLHILTIARIFNITQKTKDKLSHGASDNVTKLAKEIINLYVNDKQYYYNDIINFNKISNYNSLINMLDEPKLIGIDIGLNTKNNEGHAISAYMCGNNQILYDDNLSKPIKTNWKDSLKRILLKRNNKIEQIPFFEDDLVLANINLDEINIENIDNIKLILKEKIDELYEFNKQQIIIEPNYVSLNRDQIESQYINSHMYFIDSINPSILKIASETEE